MIIYRSFVREAARNTAAITLVLVVVMGFVGLTVLLGRAVRGDLAADILLQMLGLEALRRLDLLLTLGLYLGVLLTAARWYRDSEMTVLAACGIGLAQLLRPALALTAAVVIAISALGFYFTPWALNRMERLKLERERQTQPLGVAPGVFNETSGDKIFYAERVDRETGVLANVFLSGLGGGREGIVVARGGYSYTDQRTGDRFLALVDGNLYQGVPGEAGYRLLKFEILRVRLELKPFIAPPPKADGMGTAELLARTDADSRVEWQWRLSKPLMATVLVLFALVLAYTDPRRGRLSNLFAAILVYLIYSNLLALGQTLLKKGYVPWSAGLWWMHAGMLAIAIYLFARRSANRPLFAWPRSPRAASGGR